MEDFPFVISQRRRAQSREKKPERKRSRNLWEKQYGRRLPPKRAQGARKLRTFYLARVNLVRFATKRGETSPKKSDLHKEGLLLRIGVGSPLMYGYHYDRDEYFQYRVQENEDTRKTPMTKKFKRNPYPLIKFNMWGKKNGEDSLPINKYINK